MSDKDKHIGTGQQATGASAKEVGANRWARRLTILAVTLSIAAVVVGAAGGIGRGTYEYARHAGKAVEVDLPHQCSEYFKGDAGHTTCTDATWKVDTSMVTGTLNAGYGALRS